MSFGLLLFSLYLVFRVVWRLKIHWGYRIFLGVTVTLSMLKFKVLHILGGSNYFAPDLPGWFLILTAWFFGTALFFLAGSIVYDLLLLTAKGVCRIRRKTITKERWHKIDCRVWLALLAAAAIFSFLGMYNALKLPQIKNIEVEIADLPDEAVGTKMAFLADIHVDRYTGRRRVEQLVELTNTLQPDVVLLGGDYVDGPVSKHGDSLQPLKNLQARYGVFGVVGNHEYYSGLEEWVDFFRQMNIDMLMNYSVRLPNKLVIAGVTDPAAGRRGKELPDVKKALQKYPAAPAVILLAHQPRVAADAAAYPVALQLSGHTHGGMVWGLNYLVKRFNRNWVSGFYQVGNMQLYVSSGSGIWNGFPFRLGTRNEITLITLKKAAR